MAGQLDLVVFGASGFTGALVAEYLHAAYGAGGEVGWAIAGRSAAKLAAVRERIGATGALPAIVADATDPAALAMLVRRAKVVLTTAGPYQLHGAPLVRACVEAGTDYVDLCGEPLWMARMIREFAAPARASGARVVFSCGFDSLPFDLGVVFLQEEALRRFGAPAARVRCRVRVLKGTFSGGTLASALATAAEAGRDATASRAMADPFALTPGFAGPPQPDAASATYDDAARAWSAPFVMAAINTKNVHRTNALLGHAWGRDFVYDERVLTGEGARGASRARRLARAARLGSAVLRFGLAREALRRFVLPKPGAGPDRAARERGHYELLFIGETANGRQLRVVVKGDRDPGYGSTCKLVAESALCLARETPRTTTPGGVWTPGAAMGRVLLARLQARAGLTFAVEE